MSPGTEFSTGKSNDLWILKNFEKHDILFLQKSHFLHLDKISKL